MALQYPLLFSYGEDGYSCNIMFADHGHEKKKENDQEFRCELIMLTL
jgi:hypothetical protein